MGWFIGTYIAVVVVTYVIIAAGTYINFEELTVKEKRDIARVAFLTPVWPLFVPFFLFIGLRKLWRLADWRNGRYDYDEEDGRAYAHSGHWND